MMGRVALLAWLVCLGGCGDYHTNGPEAWWHEAVGGEIAKQRPPPPGANAPYPNLATVPPKPPPINSAEWTQRTAELTNDRIRADQAAALAPIPPATAAAAPASPGAPPAPAPTGGEASAALTAASPPAPAKPAATRPLVRPTPGGLANNPPPFNQPSETTSPPGGVAVAQSSLAAAERVANGQLPPLPTEAPPRPGIAPPPPPPLVPPTATPPAASPVAGMIVDFDNGASALDDPALAQVRVLAAERGDRGIAITGYGGATSSDPLAQSDALTLGMARAQSLATALVAQGVPYAMLRLNAESAGRGATMRLLQ